MSLVFFVQVVLLFIGNQNSDTTDKIINIVAVIT